MVHVICQQVVACEPYLCENSVFYQTRAVCSVFFKTRSHLHTTFTLSLRSKSRGYSVNWVPVCLAVKIVSAPSNTLSLSSLHCSLSEIEISRKHSKFSPSCSFLKGNNEQKAGMECGSHDNV